LPGEIYEWITSLPGEIYEWITSLPGEIIEWIESLLPGESAPLPPKKLLAIAVKIDGEGKANLSMWPNNAMACLNITSPSPKGIVVDGNEVRVAGEGSLPCLDLGKHNKAELKGTYALANVTGSIGTIEIKSFAPKESGLGLWVLIAIAVAVVVVIMLAVVVFIRRRYEEEY
jgi:hypothetical protein